MQKFNCLIVEDEPLAAEVLEDYIRQVPFLELKETCADALYAMEALQKQSIDLVFLDIHLPKLKGLDFIRTLKNPPPVIITTAYRDYAIEGYELNVLDYLVKPVNFNRFLTAVNKLKSKNTTAPVIPATDSAVAERPHLFINVSKKMARVYLDEILFIESKREYISIVTGTKTFLTKFSLAGIEEQLPSGLFLRVHRSFLVATAKIEAFTSTDLELCGHQVPIGRSYKELVLSLLEKNNTL